jgi:ABC-type Fe3+-hydroxamate transport system substrate-binding protein
VDPDAIIVLTQPGRAGRDYLEPFKALAPLRAVKQDRVLVVEAPEAYVHGPRILSLVDRLSAEVKKLGGHG